MIFLYQQTVELLCPDNETERNCWGKIEVTLGQYRVARGRGAFILTVDADESTVFKCDRCGRKFKFKEPTADRPDLYFDTV